jgi:hypothetical protein
MEISTVKLKALNLEIWRHNFEPDGEETMAVGNAIYDLEKLGGGWRLPNYTEMSIISSLIDIGILDDTPTTQEDYWTSFEDPEYEGNHGVFSFGDKSFYSRFDNEMLYVRPVRTI